MIFAGFDTLWNMKIFVDRFTNRHGKRSKNSLAKLKGKLAIVVDLDETVLNNNSLSGGSMGKGDGFYAGILVRVGKSEESGFDTGSKNFS